MIEEAHIGHTAEKIIIGLINQNDKFQSFMRTSIRNLANIELKGNLIAKEGAPGRKTDIAIIASDGVVGISLKTARKGGRPDNHLDRRWLSKAGRYSASWADVLQMPGNIRKIIENGIIRKAYNKNADLIDASYHTQVKDLLFSKLDVFLSESFRKSETELKIFAVQEYNEETRLFLFNLDETLAFIKRNIESKGISFRSRINLGDYLQIQRKAGDGRSVDARISKTDPDHPGNQLQVKLMTLALKGDAVSKGLKHEHISLNS